MHAQELKEIPKYLLTTTVLICTSWATGPLIHSKYYGEQVIRVDRCQTGTAGLMYSMCAERTTDSLSYHVTDSSVQLTFCCKPQSFQFVDTHWTPSKCVRTYCVLLNASYTQS